MPKSLAERLGHDTIFRFVRSAPLRLAEGDLLSKEYPLTAIYLYGYAAEMILKAAYFKSLGYSSTGEIDSATRRRAEKRARENGLMSGDPHDIAGWAQLLVWEKQTLHTPAYALSFGRQIVENALAVYESWRPQMRYRNTSAPAATVTAVRSASDWLIKNYPKM